MQVRKVSLSTGELSYFASGEGRPLLYLHPAGGVRWTRVLEGLAKSFALHVPVVPGFDGTSAHDAVKSMRGLPSLVDHLVLECPAGFRPKGKGERPADAGALRKLLFLHPEKLPPQSKLLEQEVANRRMLL